LTIGKFRGVATACLVAVLTCAGMAGQTIRASVSSAGQEGNGKGEHTSISGDGGLVVFAGYASNLVPSDSNGVPDIFLRDCAAGTTLRVSVSSTAQQANGGSDFPWISSDGGYVAFESLASNLVSGDSNGKRDIFVRDVAGETTTQVSISSTGQAGNDSSYRPVISADGRHVAFASLAGNLVDGDDNGEYDIFVHDRQTGQTSRVSVSSSGQQADGYSWRPAISADGRYVVFESWATNLVVDDTNGYGDIFLHDCQTGSTERVNVGPGGVEANSLSSAASVSGDGRYVAFESSAHNLVANDTNGQPDVFVRDRQMEQTFRASVSSEGQQGNDDSWGSTISADGRYVAFDSLAGNLVPNDTNGPGVNGRDVFVHDRHTGVTTRASVSSTGGQGDAQSFWPRISGDGRHIAFPSDATNLVPGDTNGPGEVGRDVLVHDRAGDLPGDLDADNDVDLDDLLLLVSSMSGPGVPTDQHAADIDGDGDCDLAEAAVLAENFTGPK